MALVDIIIPAYKAEDTIDRAIASIACQTVAKDVVVNIIDDCGPVDGAYAYLINKYSGIFSCGIRIMRTCVNGGPGVARQYGIDHTSCPFIVFLDADDTLGDSLSLECLLSDISSDETACVVTGAFEEEQENKIIKHENDMVWMHGKIYRRSFLDQYDIRFHPTSRANEDNGFNNIIKLICAMDKDRWNILAEDRVVYIWHNRKNSITRDNDYAYYYGASFPGYVENMIYVAMFISGRYGIDRLMNSDAYLHWCVTIMCFLYAYYCECCVFSHNNAAVNLEACKLFYRLIYLQVDRHINIELLSRVFTATMISSFKRFPNYIPIKTIFQFIDDLKE